MEQIFLPLNREDMEARGWDQVDFAYIIGDAYVDHPSFGHAVISRVLESRGYRVGIISQPDWSDPASIDVFGRATSGISHIGRQYGFHGKSLFCFQKTAENRCLYARR